MGDDHPRRILGRYRLLGELASGGTARVFRAHDEQLDRVVAVKLLHPHLLPDETSRRRLAAEARAAAGLAHPGIAAVYDVDAGSQAPALVMELVDGESLAQRLARSGPTPAPDVARLGAEVADALYLAHRQGIVHRDVKPGNILLERGTGRARLVDFGIAQSLAVGAESLTQTGTALGTPRYMAPEQMAGAAVGPRTDLWSLGVVLYEALAARAPFPGTTPLAIAEMQRAGPPPLEGVEPALAAVVRACLAPDMNDRPLHAGAVAAALRSWLEGGPEATTLAQVPGVAAAPLPRPAYPRSAQRRPALLVGAALASVAAAGLGLVIGLPSGIADAPTPPPTPTPTADWMTPLLAAHAEACGEPLRADELAGLEPAPAEELVNELIAGCLEVAEEDDDEEDGGEGGGRGNGNEGNGNEGNGNGRNGNGQGRGGD